MQNTVCKHSATIKKKSKFGHLLTLMSFQTSVSFFLMLNTKEDILRNFEIPNSCESPLT